MANQLPPHKILEALQENNSATRLYRCERNHGSCASQEGGLCRSDLTSQAQEAVEDGDLDDDVREALEDYI